jgi:hypothetical protein
MKIPMMKSHSNQTETIGSQVLGQIPNILRENFAKVAEVERNRCAELVQQIADSTEDQVIKDVLNDVVLAIRRLPNVPY